ncbi:hypothetical protein COV15_02350 [Candidatus Woesearchaeota archaeon CG10_big_fil_rev_8_21_14_0_10_34_12]|nr:MAG: hypothetical protein COV15_02350 [Candidatus Woesearchaeota archaeon CG10_big_fil_rev_8_21_14_0_10_34_12]
MVKLVFTPDWFLGKDVLISLFSFFILATLFWISFKNYKFSKDKKSFLYFGLGFLLIALGELSTILTKLVLYYNTTFTQQIGQIIITYNMVKSVDIFYKVGFFFYKLLTLAGLYTLYRVNSKQTTETDIILASYFIILSAAVSSSFYYLFHLTALILIAFIINKYFRLYKKNKLPNTRILITSFSLLGLSQLIFIFSKLELFFVLANLIQLLSYIMFMILVIKITLPLKNEKKKK